EEGTQFIDAPLQQLAVEKGGNKIMASVAAVGAAMGLLGLPLETLSPILVAQFAKKGEPWVLPMPVCFNG
ncbi:MAG: 2-oxoacid:acceptor oxidoreductase family protein, partial [Chloroflexi bacterium]|nr:2-oxoacid:acceptor oxidoreductase family protein [Chloroflexota bacterium]